MNVENIPPKSPGGIEKMYQKKTQLEHILLRPDTYIGSVEAETENIFVLEEETKRLVNRKVTYVPGLYKIFDEILVNAADNKQRDKTMNILKVDINAEEGSISVYNNGRGIPIKMHKEHGIYVPELIFGHLLTSSNYNDTEKKTVGGRNGFGAKLANIFSTEFTVETCDASEKLYFKQTFKDNMSTKTKAKVSAYDKPDWTRITFKPDLAKFGMIALDQDILSLFKKRVYDIAGTSSKDMKVFLNGERVKINSFKDYVKLHFVDESKPLIHFQPNDRWEICVGISDGHFQQVSFVNSICTMKGGKHVGNVTDQVTKHIGDHIAKKHKGAPIKSSHIKNHLWVFVNCLIENPAFDSQTKDTLTTNKQKFGSKCDLDEKFMKEVMKSGIVENVLSWAKFKESKDLKKGDGKKKTRLAGIPKLDDANFAGGKHASDCTLILTEGDSAKALAVSGLSVVGRDHYGVYPLKGKMLNVREANHKQIMGNVEITQLKQIIGLQQGKVYEDTKSLRYGHVMIMTDQDHDGSHIKGLIINLFMTFWPSLLKIDGFLMEFITPIVKVSKGKKEESFYTVPEYTVWKEEHNDGKGWKIKYYKGLGTSTAKEAKEYFSALERHKIEFMWTGEEDDKMIELAFSKKMANQRKDWLAGVEPGTFLDMNIDKLGYSEFVNKELILYSVASNQRAIPALMDGLKPGQRKILYACFKRQLTKEIKVAQLAGYVSEHGAYHHGEMSLTATIVGLAQNYCGANNINLLMPNGQFGTRHNGGKDAASARYIFTNMSPVTRTIFPESDDNLLENLIDDGQVIEPQWYAPIIPMVLVNGSAGIGTGWSSNIPNYNPRDLVENIRHLLRGEELDALKPWYKGFNGSIEKVGAAQYSNDGRIEKIDELNYKIDELPIEKWTHDYKLFLETLIESGFLKDFKEHHTDNTVAFTVTAASEEKALAIDAEGLEKFFKLSSTLAISNMVLFDTNGFLRKYTNVNDILRDFFEVRMDLYVKRKEYLADVLTQELKKVSNKVRFILAVISDDIKIRNVKKSAIFDQLMKLGFDPITNSKKQVTEEKDDDEEEAEDATDLQKGYNYLLSMSLWNLTMEKVDALKAEKDGKEQELKTLLAKSPQDLWHADLDVLLEKLEEHEQLESASDAEAAALIRKTKKAKATKKGEEEDDWAPTKPKKIVAKPAARPVSAPVVAKSVAKVSTISRPTQSSVAKSSPPKVVAPSSSMTNVLEEKGKKPATKKAATKKVAAKAASKAVKEVSDIDISDYEQEIQDQDDQVQPVSSRPGRAAKKPVSYGVDLSSGEDEQEEEEVSLADRMNAKMGSSISHMFEKPKLKQTTPVVTKKTQKVVQGSDSEAEESDPGEASSDYAPTPEKMVVAKKAPAKKPAATKVAAEPTVAAEPKAQAKRKKASPKKPVAEPIDESQSPPGSPFAVSPAPKRQKAKAAAKPIIAQKSEMVVKEVKEAVKKVTKPRAPKAAAVPKAAPKPKPATKVVKAAKKDSEEDEVDEIDASPVIKKTPRPARARKVISYAESDGESEEEPVESSEDDDAGDDSDF